MNTHQTIVDDFIDTAVLGQGLSSFTTGDFLAWYNAHYVHPITRHQASTMMQGHSKSQHKTNVCAPVRRGPYAEWIIAGANADSADMLRVFCQEAAGDTCRNIVRRVVPGALNDPRVQQRLDVTVPIIESLLSNLVAVARAT